MRTLRYFAELLAAADSLDGLAPLATAAGCTDTPAPLDADTQRALGLGAQVLNARVASGPGALRALLVELRRGVPMHESLAFLGSRLASRSPHVLWLLLAVEHHGSEVGIAAWPGDRPRPRVAALVADRQRLVDSDAETLRAIASAGAETDLLTHARWVEVLGRDALTRRFYRTLERVVRAMAASATAGKPETRTEAALLCVSRLLFLAFLEAKGWLDGDHAFLSRRFDYCMATGGAFHRRVLDPLLFGTLNTPVRRRAPAARAFGRVPFLNGGLFSRAAIERAAPGLTFSDEAFGALFGELFAPFRFTAREESVSFTEAAVDPELLGRAFESLMHGRERRDSGAFYTPHALVARVATAGLERTLAAVCGTDAARAMLAGEAVAAHHQAAVRERLATVRVLDPACGSGAFLVHVLERLSALARQAGDARSLTEIRRDVVSRSIFGVDVNPTAVWLCELRLWLSVVVESDERDPLAVVPLPNLDRNIRVGDSLAPIGRPVGGAGTAAATLRQLRERYARSTGRRKETLARALEREERRCAMASLDAELAALTAKRRELVLVRRGRDLFGGRRGDSRAERAQAAELRARSASLRARRRRLASGGALPFSFAAHFADVSAQGGFDLVLGNPPWIRLHRLAPAIREAYRRAFRVARAAAWTPGAATAAAGPGFASQMDVAALFVERGLQILAPGGVLAYLLPVKLWHSLAGGGVRLLLCEETELCRLEDHSEAQAAFDAAVYPSLLVARRSADPAPTRGSVAMTAYRRGRGGISWCADPARLALDASPGSPWLLLPREVRDAFDSLVRAGTPLGESVIGRPYLGVKCGCNEAFVVRTAWMRDGMAGIVAADGRRGEIESDLLRPLLRGEELAPWRARDGREHIVWTHDMLGAPLAKLPPGAARWFARWRHDLVARSDARRRARWWMLFRTEAARTDRPRVVWADIGRSPRAVVIARNDPVVPLNSCYVARCRDDDDALTLAALLNGPLANGWLNALAEPARGGYRRYLGWTVALLPLPRDWARARTLLAPVARRHIAGRTSGDLLPATLEAYGLTHADAAPLLAWSAQ